jgi:hypothetical protein
VKLKNLIVPTLVFLMAGSFSAVSDQRSSERVTEHLGFDFMVIGETVSKQHLRNWHRWKQAGDDCTHCALTQAYPGDKQTSPVVTGSITQNSSEDQR